MRPQDLDPHLVDLDGRVAEEIDEDVARQKRASREFTNRRGWTRRELLPGGRYEQVTGRRARWMR